MKITHGDGGSSIRRYATTHVWKKYSSQYSAIIYRSPSIGLGSRVAKEMTINGTYQYTCR
jgi:hypothetical protein